MCTVSPLRFEHIFRDADVNRYNAVVMTRTRDAFIASKDVGIEQGVQSSLAYEKVLKTTIQQLHERSHRTTLEHQPHFEWEFEGTKYASPCWYFEWVSLVRARYELQRAQAQAHIAEESFSAAKKSYAVAVESATAANAILSKWLWRAPHVPLWCQRHWWDAQEAECNALRAMCILSHCEKLEDATPRQLYGAASKIEDYATEAATLWPTDTALRAIDYGRIHKAWWKSHLLWEDDQHGAAIGLATAWSSIPFTPLEGFHAPAWENIIHDWTHENNTVHYDKITTPTSI